MNGYSDPRYRAPNCPIRMDLMNGSRKILACQATLERVMVCVELLMIGVFLSVNVKVTYFKSVIAMSIKKTQT